MEGFTGPKLDTAGLGAGAKKLEAPFTFSVFVWVLSIVLEVARAPLLAARSWVWMIDKKNAKLGLDALRWIHGTCIFWRSVFRHMYKESNAPELPYYCHGSAPFRRREAAIVTAHVNAARLRAAGASFSAMSHDATNAFMCSRDARLNAEADLYLGDGPIR